MELTRQSQVAANADREALKLIQTQLLSLRAAQAHAESQFTSALTSQQSSIAISEAHQATQMAALLEQLAAAALQSQHLPQQLTSLCSQLQEEQAQLLTQVQASVQQVPQQLLASHAQLKEEQLQQMGSLRTELRDDQLQQQLQHESAASQLAAEVNELRLALLAVQQKQQQQQTASSTASVQISAQHAAHLASLEEEVQNMHRQLQQQQHNAEAEATAADEQLIATKNSLQQLQEQSRLQTEAQAAVAAKASNDLQQQQLKASLSVEFAQCLEAAQVAQASSSRVQMTEMQQAAAVDMQDMLARQLDTKLLLAVEQEVDSQIAAKLAVACGQQHEQQQVHLWKPVVVIVDAVRFVTLPAGAENDPAVNVVAVIETMLPVTADKLLLQSLQQLHHVQLSLGIPKP